MRRESRVAEVELVGYQFEHSAGWFSPPLKLTMMLNVQNQRCSQIHRIAAVAVICLFVLRGISFLGMAAADGGNPGFAHAVLGDRCASQDGSDGPRKHSHSEHCVLCCSVARDIVASHTLVFAKILVLTPGEMPAPTPRAKEAPDLEKASGLIANWSATSPPRTRGL
jgi:hypothetical protein